MEKTSKQDALMHIVARRDKPFLEERYIDSFKERGVFTRKAIAPSTFVVEYRGRTFPDKDKKPEKKCGDTLKNFLFEFSWKGECWCIDASKEDKTLGRLVNDDHTSPNCEMKKVNYDGKPHLCLFAVKEITKGEEITYNYGNASYPWRSKDCYDGSSSSRADVHANSTPRKEKFEDSEAASSYEDARSDDDDDSEPVCDNESFGNNNSQLDVSDNSLEDLDSSQDVIRHDASRSQQEDKAAFSSDESDKDRDYVPRKAMRRPKECSYTSKNYCYACGKGYAKIARHLLTHADEEPEIAEIVALPKNSKERRKLLDKLRIRGNYEHNQDVFKKKCGKLKMKRLPLTKSTMKISAKTHIYCLFCKCLLRRDDAWRHVARCASKTAANSATDDKRRVLGEIGPTVWKMLLKMQPEETAKAVQSDYLLLQLSAGLIRKYGFRYDYIRQRLGEMGRLLIALQEKSVFSFEDAVKPKNFYKVVKAVKEMAGFDEKMQSYDKPSLALKLGHSLKKIGTIVLAGVGGNEQMMKDTKKFMKLCAEEWSELVPKTAVNSLSGQKVNSPSTIPFTRDVQIFHRYLERTAASAIESLEMDGNAQAYSALCRVTLAQASVLNKCAPEVSKMTVETFQERDDTIRVLSKRFIKINVPNETGQNVAVLLTSDLVSAITLLVSKRQACGIHPDNPFLFAKPNSDSTSIFHGEICIGAFSSLCRALNPEHLRSVHLHKHIARIFQVLNLENDELHHLAKLLGHKIRADREYYRSPEAAVELAKIAKLILAMEKGSLERFKGNSLEQMEIEDELEPDVEQGNPGNSDAKVDNEGSELVPEQSDAVQQQAVTEKQSRQLTPEQDALEHIKASRDKPFLEQMFIEPFKGKGVFTHEAIEPSAFVVEYRGKIIPQKEIRKKNCGDALNNYMFDFAWNGTNWRVDASEDDGSLGRLVNNDEIKPNCKMKTVVYEGKPHLCLFAVKEITQGQEITYNYGDSSCPLQSTKSGEDLKTSQMDPSAAASSSEDERVEDSAEATSSDESCFDDEYVPDEEPGSDDSLTSNNNQKSPKLKKNSPDPDSSKQQRLVQKAAKASSIKQVVDEANDNPDSFTSDDEPEGPTCTNKNFCYVCGKGLKKIARHLFTHRNEVPEIAAVFGLPLHTKERTAMLNELRNRGNFQHNEEVLRTRRGKLKVNRRKPGKGTDLKALALCLYCKVMRNRKDMWRHVQRCAAKRSSKYRTPAQRKILSLVDAAQSTDLKEVSSDVKKFIENLKSDKVTSVILNDPHIQQLAQCIYHTNEGKKSQGKFTNSLRLMGRLLLKLRDKSINSIADAVKSQNFSKVVEAAKELACFNEETKTNDKPSVWLHLGNLLRKIAAINYARALKEDADKEKMEEVETFMKLCEKEWASVHRSKTANNTPTILFIHDVQLLFQCLEETVASGVESLTMYECPPVYHALLRVTVAHVSVLNKNMVEVSKVTLKSFNERDKTEPHEDAAVCQSQLDQILSKHTVKINVRNNKGKKVAVTLTPKLLDALTLLVSKRDACGVHEKNVFLFAKPAATWMSFYQGHVCLNMFVGRCGAKNRVNLRSVCFRKHIARFFQILSLTNEELDQLAKLLGRDIRTDREYYQTPEAAVDIAKISELLTAMESGSLERFEGKSLEEIEIADELEPDMEQENPEKCDAENDESDVENDNCDAGGDNDESGSSLQLSGLFSSKASCSTTKKPSKCSRYSPSPFSGYSLKKRGRGRPRKQESENAASELKNVSTEKNDWPEETPESYDVNTPEKTLSHSNENATKMSFSDDDEDMNVDFDMDFDSSPTTEQPSKCSRYSPSPISGPSLKKRGRGRPRKQESENSCSSLLPSGLSSSKGSLSTTKEPSNCSRNSSSPISDGSLKKRGRGRPRKQESENAASELKDVSTEKNDWSEDKCESYDVNTAEKTLSHSNDNATKVSFSDDDEDMNVDFDMDSDSFSTTEQPSKCSRYSPSPVSGSSLKKRGRGRPRKQESENSCSSLLPSGLSSSKGSLSTTKEPSNCSRNSSSPISDGSLKKRGRGRPRKQESENAASELKDVSTEKNDWSEDKCESYDVNTAEKTLSHSNDNATKVSFSDDDEDMNVDFDMDSDSFSTTEQPSKCSRYSPSPVSGSSLKKRGRGRPRKQESENSCSSSFLSGLSSSKDSLSTTKEPSNFSRYLSSPVSDGSLKKRGRGRPRKQERENAASELKDVSTEKNDWSEDKPDKTWSHSNDSATKMSFSDDDEDMNVDFDMNFDSDEDIRNEEYVGDVNTSDQDVVDKTKQDNASCDAKKTDSSPEYHSTVADLEDHPKKGAEQNRGSRRSCATLNTDKNKLLAVVASMKEVKILIPKLDIAKLKDPAHISRLSSAANSVKQPLKDQPVRVANNQSPTTFTNTEDKTKPSDAKTIQMTCSRCKKSMMKGQTAFQKKGFTDVFCSKNCLFEIFPINKPAAKTCHYCQKTISQLQDLIMAAVDTKGTMKDFCSVTCLCSFKSKPESSQTSPSVCSKCSKSCTITCEFTLYEVVYKFCSGSCFDDFRRDNTDICENCRTTCTKKPLKLKLEEETITICSGTCLDKFIENKDTPCRCTTCHISQPCSDMVHDKSSENIVELFCTRSCATSYRLAVEYKLHGKECSAHKKKKSMKLKEKLTAEDSTVNRNVASPAAESGTPTIIIADSSVVCCLCGKELPKGQTIYQAKSSPEVYCSASCLSERHPNNKLGTKSCYNCLQMIMRPHNMILAPVDDSGTVRELCSNTCLTSVNSKRNTMRCRMCSRLAFCKVRQSLDGLMLRVCSDTCFIDYHRVKNFPVFTCDICTSVFINKPLELKREDGGKTICSEECLVKVKENIETPQLCPMCQTSHQMSDMVENINDEGSLDFFCSNRCMMVHKAQSVTVSERNSPPLDEKDIKEVKPSLPNLGSIKEEPIDEEYKEYFSFSISAEDIKDEPKVAKEDLKIGSVFSFTEQNTSTVATETKMDLTASCSNCKNALVDGETVYQRKSHAEIFCSSPCLLNFYQMKQAKNTCHFCLQAITKPQGVLQAPVDTEETMKDFCSQACLSSFNYKRITSAKIHIKPVASRSQCSVCSRYCISRHEIIHLDVVHKLCSDPCFLRFCNMNNLLVCVNCGSHCNTPVVLKMKDGSKKLCSAECLAQFRKKTQTQQPCAMCCTARLMTDMVENENSENEVELFCTTSCVMASKIQAVSASGLPLDCDHCGKTTVPACHLAMSDASIRNFCTLTCAMTFKETQNVDTNPPAASDQPQCDFHKPPEKLLCAQCRRILKTTPEVVQKKGKMNFVCSLACSEEFKRVNNIMGKCEYCKNERIIKDVKKVDNKDCYFCSDGCRMLYHHELKEKWGEYCHSCAYCLSISKTVVTAQYKGTEEEFCSEDCSANYKMLFCHVAKCDTCGHEGKLRQSLPILGEVKHFCDLKCLLHFCNKKVQMVNTVSSPSRPVGTVESSPVIANVISLAGALARQHRASASSAQQVPVSDIQTKVVGHASVQTVPNELKNKSTLCTPLVHNKGVSCTTQTVDKGAQTDKSGPTVLPVPVPVFVPVPMNMYSQYTPKPVGLPIPLPVPVFLPMMVNSPQREDGQKEGEVTKEGQKQEVHTSKEHKSNCSDDQHADHHAAFRDQEDSFSDTHKETPSHSQVCESSAPQLELKTPAPLPPPPPVPAPPPAPAPAPAPAVEIREDPCSSPSSATAPPLLQQTVGKVHKKNKGRKLQQSSKAARATSREHPKLKSRRGVDAWRRWIQWRESQTNPDLVSSPSLTFSKDVHHCSASELSDGLSCFITEVKRPDGEPYAPDSLFYLCLGIQQHLLENGHLENIFSDPIFKKFSVRINKILKGFKPAAVASGFIYSRVEEEFLWDCKQLGAYSPIVLLNSLLFFSCKYFGFTTVKQHRQLSFSHLRRCSKTNQNNAETSFLRFYPPKSFYEAESDADGVPAKRRKRDKSKEDTLVMMENPENPLRCPVRLYEFYLSKCPESVRHRADLFYLHPDHSCVPNSPLWFSSNPLDDRTVEAMLVRILAVREVQRENSIGVDR